MYALHKYVAFFCALQCLGISGADQYLKGGNSGYEAHGNAPSPQMTPATQNFKTREVVITAPPELGCPPSFELDPSGSKCVKHDKQPSQLGCQAGWIFKDGSCSNLLAVEPSFTCPDGFKSDASQCTKQLYAPKQLTCPRGFDFETDACTKMVQTSPDFFCSPSFTLNVAAKVCLKEEAAEPTLSCEGGFRIFNGSCRQELTARRGAKGCESGFMPSKDGSCKKVEIIAPELICPSGTDLKIDVSLGYERDICQGVIEEPAVERCPPEFTAVFDESSRITKCSGKSTAAPTVHCPEAFEVVNGVCSRSETEPKAPQCPETYEYVNGQCVVSVNERPVILCPVGYTLAEETCTKELRTKPRPKCKTGFTYDSLTKQCARVEVKHEKVKNSGFNFGWGAVLDNPLE